MSIQQVLKAIGPRFINITEQGFIYGPQGKMILKNVEKEWYIHNVKKSQFNVCLSPNTLDTTKCFSKKPMNDIPFGTAGIESSNLPWNSIETLPCHAIEHRLAKLNIIDWKITAKDTFRKFQRQRKVWWHKLSQWPSRFKFIEEESKEDLNIVKIQAEFPFGSLTVETITHYKNVDNNFPTVHNGRKDFTETQIIEHVTSLDWACLVLLCDSYISNTSATMYLHPKLVPYKVALFMENSEYEINEGAEQLHRFVLYLNNILKEKGLSTILNSKEIVNGYLVPFTVIASKTSVKNGIVYVICRSTSLKEHVHISKLADYIFRYCYQS